MTDWDKIEKEWTAMDLVNLQCGFKLSSEREKWVADLLKKRLKEEGYVVEEQGELFEKEIK